jgi:formylglycine-generating enzyme required for sulfatase activity
MEGEELAGSKQKVYRGGCWNSNPKFSRCAARSYELPSDFFTSLKAYYKNDLGFRLVRRK